jgi:hypothetical protein
MVLSNRGNEKRNTIEDSTILKTDGLSRYVELVLESKDPV